MPQQPAVLCRRGLTLLGVHDHVPRSGPFRNRLPLDCCRERRTTASTQPGDRKLSEHPCPPNGVAVAASRAVLREGLPVAPLLQQALTTDRDRTDQRWVGQGGSSHRTGPLP
ncbi:hypothetical protein ACFPM0_36375 [Pseudonocardia sulfidoxydans]|uniref:hypothetical protein n=1 Tax=Pseudonocardia sulfidoxydans TaxID=54011 RepID=UPI00360A7B5B